MARVAPLPNTLSASFLNMNEKEGELAMVEKKIIPSEYIPDVDST